MFHLFTPSGDTRPSVLEPNKDKDYHCTFARYCLGQANGHLHSEWVEKIATNKRFYKGDQWNDSEDIDTFLKDDENQDRNRLAIVMNHIRPMVEQYRGNAIRMNINATAKGMSPQVITRRETKLTEMLHYTKIANDPGNPFSSAIKKKFPVGDNEGETRAIFENTYQDELVQDMNYLISHVSNRNRFIDKQVRVAFELAFSGLAVMSDFEYAGHQQFNVLPSERFFFDREAKEDDLTDASFMGDFMDLSPSEIFEMYPDIERTDKEAIERYVKHFSGSVSTTSSGTVIHNGRVPVYRVYWRDSQADEYGYVMDQYGYEYLTKINYTYEGEDQPRYTDKDLIVGKSQRAKKILKGKLKRRLFCDTLRMAIIIPREVICSEVVNQDYNRDIILDWGIAPYQETEMIEFNSVKYPYKAHTWAYLDGEILSPLDDAIDPQRFINRVWSAAENQINNSRGAGMVYDKSMVDDESELLRNSNQSKPIGINAKGRGIQNAVGSYDSTIKAGVQSMFSIIQEMKNSIKETTGINEALQGESMGGDQLVGVTKLMIQRGSLMQEPFYNAVSSVFLQCYQSIASRGKRIYADNERSLAMAVGDDGVKVIKITKEHNLETFRVFVTRENSDDVLKDAANQMLLSFRELAMLDEKRIAALWDRSTPSDVSRALRSYAAEKEEINRMSQKDADAKEQMLIQQAGMEQEEQRNMMYEQEAREDIKDMENKRHDMKKEFTKAMSKLAPGNKRAEAMLIKNAQNFAQ